jgi:septal ring factor EnvC (AmiA/AmiB activator)
MIEQSADFIPIWMLLSAALGFIIGEAYGDQNRHRKYLEQANADLRDQLQNSQSRTPALQHAINQQRRVINDIHRRIVAVTKGLEKHAS